MSQQKLKFFIMLPFLAAFFLPSAATGAVISMSVAKMVRQSSGVVVATVESRQTRWNDQHTLIVTDYEILVEEHLLGSSPEKLTLTVVGGTLDGETHGSSVTTHLEVGMRYILFLEASEHPLLSPFTGVWQGVIREVVDESGDSYPAGGPSGATKVGDGSVSFWEFVGVLRGLIDEIESSPAAEEESTGTSDAPLPAKPWDPDADNDSRGSVVAPHAATFTAPLRPDDVLLISESSVPQPGRLAAGIRPGAGGSKYNIERWPALPVVFEAFPTDWYWSPNDQYMMSRWNVYRSGLFMVYATPDGTWAWGNGVFELAGWPSNATMISQFGAGWGAGTLGVTYYRWTTGPIIEADIALNPAFSWTLDNAYGTRGDNSVWGFEQTMLHELGHSFGVKHPWETQDVWWDSVMNYSPKSYRHPILHTDDTNAVRAAYPGTSIHDGLITFYETHDDPLSNNAIYDEGDLSSTQVAPGDFLTISDLALQNAGTDNLVDPVVDVYLTPNRISWSGADYLGTQNFSLTIEPFYTYRVQVSSIQVPQGTPPGTFYVGLYLNDGSDGSTGNNSAWSRYDNQLTVLAVPDLALSSPSLSAVNLLPAQSLTVDVTVRNDGNTSSASTTLRYYSSTNSVISVFDTELATSFFGGLSAGGSSTPSVLVTAPATDGTYWIGACVDTVSGELITSNNCSAGVQVTVATPSATALAQGVSANGTINGTVSQSSWSYYYIDVPADIAALTVTLDNLPASYPNDVDLYVRFGAPPTFVDWDCRPYLGGGSAESCSFQGAAEGRWWIGLNNYDVGSIPYTVAADWTLPFVFADGFESGDTSDWTP